jgi:hypothetical protein
LAETQARVSPPAGTRLRRRRPAGNAAHRHGNLRHSAQMSNAELKNRLHFACLVILAAGLCSATLIYLFAADVPSESVGYVVINGTVYPISPSDSSIYRREVERFGGKAALAFDNFNRWFLELWRGKTLAKTVACISVLVSLGIYLFANSLQPNAQPQGDDTHKRDESS